MAKKTTVAIAHSGADLGKPGECSREQLDVVKQMIRQIADQTMGGMQNIVKRGDKVLIKVNTVIPVAPNAGFTTDPRMLQALIELVGEQNPSRIQIGDRCAMGADTRQAMQECGLADVAQRTGAELCPFEHAPFDMYKIDRPIAFNEFPVPRPVREADVYIGLPKFKVHVHTVFTGALKLQFGNLPNYDWMVRCHHDNIYQKIVNLTRAANPKWFVMDSDRIDRPIAFNEFPVPRPVREADVYIGLPKFKVHVHTVFTGALKLQFGNLPNYDWMVRCHHDNIYQKIVNLTRAANPKWFVMD